MKKTQNINPESQDITELQAMVKTLMLEKTSGNKSVNPYSNSSSLPSTASSRNARRR
jgi:hypothetical protein